jgi:hypothetical protein
MYKPVEEEVSLEIIDNEQPSKEKVPIFYEDFDDYAPFDIDQEEM